MKASWELSTNLSLRGVLVCLGKFRSSANMGTYAPNVVDVASDNFEHKAYGWAEEIGNCTDAQFANCRVLADATSDMNRRGVHWPAAQRGGPLAPRCLSRETRLDAVEQAGEVARKTVGVTQVRLHLAPGGFEADLLGDRGELRVFAGLHECVDIRNHVVGK